VAFLELGEGARRWLIEAGASGATRVRSKMDKAIELAAALGPAPVEQALGLAAIAGRFADDDLVSILDHLRRSGVPGDVVIVDEGHSVQPGTGPWERFGA